MPATKSRNPKASATRRARIADHYWRHRLTHGAAPHSVFAFCEAIGIPEQEFYAEFSGFPAVESAWWKDLADSTQSALEKDPDFASYDARQRLLAFHYTFLAALQPHRSRLVAALPPPGPGIPDALRELHATARAFFEGIVALGIRGGLIADRKRLTDLYPRALWELFRWVLEYHRRDASKGFEDTDAFVEKTVRLFFDAAGAGVVESALDLARFLARHLPKPA